MLLVIKVKQKKFTSSVNSVLISCVWCFVIFVHRQICALLIVNKYFQFYVVNTLTFFFDDARNSVLFRLRFLSCCYFQANSKNRKYKNIQNRQIKMHNETPFLEKLYNKHAYVLCSENPHIVIL